MVLIIACSLSWFWTADKLIAQCGPERGTVSCMDAPLICQLAKFCDTLPVAGALRAGVSVCGGAQTLTVHANNFHYIRFIASMEGLSIRLQATDCRNGAGIAAVIFEGCQAGPDWRTIGDCQTDCTMDAFDVGANGRFEVGKIYTLMIAGCGDNCAYEILSVAPGASPPVLFPPGRITGPGSTCPGGTVRLVVNNPLFGTNFFWQLPDGSEIETEGREVELTVPPDQPPGPYTVCLSDAINQCFSLVDDFGYLSDVCFTINVREPTVIDLPEVNFCYTGSPYSISGYDFYPPSGVKEMQFKTYQGCDSIVRVNINFIQHEPDDHEYIACAADFPLFHPEVGVVNGPTEFDVSARDQFGCDSSYKLKVLSLDFTFNVSIPTRVLECPGDAINIDASNVLPRLSDGRTIFGGVSYSWLKDGEEFGAAPGPFLYVTQKGKYQLTVSVNYGGVECVKTFDFDITENFVRPPAPVFVGDSVGCIGTELDINIGNYDGKAEILWQGGTHYQIVGSRTNRRIKIRLTRIGHDTICVRMNKPNCDSLYTIGCLPIEVTAGVAVTIDGDNSFCSGGSTTLSIKDNYASYEWRSSTGGSFQGKSISVSSPGIYTVTVTETGGCTGTGSISVEEHIPPSPQINGSRTFCAGQQTLLSVGQPYDSYRWSAAGNPQTRDLTVNQPGTYTVTVTDANGCTGTSSIVVTESDRLEPQISGDLRFCEGGQSTLDAGGGFNQYQWSEASTNRTLTVNSSGVYSVTVSDASGCTGSAQVTVTEVPNPVARIESAATALCAGAEVILHARPTGLQYRWSGNISGPSLPVNTAGTYSLTVTDANGCTGVTSVEITERDEPTVSISGDLTYCAGTSTQLTAGPGTFTAYEWNGSAGGATLEVNTVATYTVVVTDVFGCTGSSSVQVNDIPNPQPQITGDASFCAGESGTLSTTEPFDSYVWNNTPGGSTTTVTTSGTYTVQVTDHTGCTGTATFAVVVHNNPQPEIGGSTTFCSGFYTTLDAGNYSAYNWSGGTPRDEREVEITAPGTYTVTVTDVNGCQGTSQVTVEEATELSTIISGDRSFCAGGSTQLDAGPGFTAYQWSNGNTGRTITAAGSGVYTVTVTGVGGCTGTATASVEEYTNPVPVVTGPASFCTGLTVTLDAGAGYASYRWSTGSTDRTLPVSASGVYVVTVTDANGCTGTASLQVEQEDQLSTSITGDLAFCAGGSTMLDAEPGFDAYRWSTGSTDQTAIVTGAGVYTVTVTAADGCTGSASVTVAEYANPVPRITGPDKFCQGGTATLDAGNFASYIWSTGGTGRTVAITTAGTYSVTVTDGNGCTGSGSFATSYEPELVVRVDGDRLMCTSGSATIFAESGYATYQWDDGVTGRERTIQSPGVYTVRVTTAQGCIGSGSIVVNEIPPPVADAGEDQSLSCIPTEYVRLGSDRTSTGSHRYEWTEIEFGHPIGGAAQLYINTNTPGTYVLAVEDLQTGCIVWDTVVVTPNNDRIAGAELNVANPLCFNNFNGVISLEGVFGGTAPFEMYLNQILVTSNNRVGDLPPGRYNILVVDSKGCQWEIDTTLYNPELLTIDAGPDRTITFGDTLWTNPVFSPATTLLSHVTWVDDSGNVLCDGCPIEKILLQPEKNTRYTITITNIYGCVATDHFNVIVEKEHLVYVPGGFSPDENGKNDRFTIFGGEDLKVIKSLRVFDRWGQMVFEAADIPPGVEEYGWDGRFEGRELPPAVFVYIAEIEYVDGVKTRIYGEVTLIR